MRFRPRFTVRTLAIFVTLVCAYFGAWEATKRYGVPKIDLEGMVDADTIAEAGSPMPLVVWQDEFDFNGTVLEFVRKYYFWLFGPKFKLPFESEWAPDPNPTGH